MRKSDKGRNWDGCELNEENLNAGVSVQYKEYNETIFETANRYHTLVELCVDNIVYIIADMKDIYLLADE